MKLMTWVAVVMMACADVPVDATNLHDELTDCEGWYANIPGAPRPEFCERACVHNQNVSGSNCRGDRLATSPKSALAVDCRGGAFSVDGVWGCCDFGGLPRSVLFYECPQLQSTP